MPVDKIADPVAAAKAYGNMTNAAKKPGIGADAPSFGELIRNSAKSAIQSLRGGEKAQAQAVTGKATLTDVVEAVTAAEMTLQSVVAIRDRMIGAYQEIMRMPI